MKRRPTLLVTMALLGALGLALKLGIAIGEQTPPTENKGVNVSPGTALELSQEIDSVDGRQLRLRIVTIDPGGVGAIHSHKGRPAVAYVVKGAIVEHREGGWTKAHVAGGTITETKDVTHWAENTGSEPAIIVAVDVFKP